MYKYAHLYLALNHKYFNNWDEKFWLWTFFIFPIMSFIEIYSGYTSFNNYYESISRGTLNNSMLAMSFYIYMICTYFKFI